MFKKLAIILTAVVVMLFALPSIMPSASKVIPVEPIPLGLDLKGGAQILLKVGIRKVITDKYNQLKGDVIKAMKEEQNRDISFLPKSLKVEDSNAKDAIEVDYNKIKMMFLVGNEKDVNRAEKAVRRALGDDLDISSNGKQIIVKYESKALEKIIADIVENSISSVRRRIDEFGTKDPSIHSQGEEYILVQLPGEENNTDKIKNALGKTAQLTFHLVKEDSASDSANEARAADGVTMLPMQDQPDLKIPVYNQIEVSGDMLKRADVGFDEYSRPAVLTKFDSTGTRKFAKLTTEHVGERFAIVLDGQVISAPVINEPIPGGSGQITGSFTVDEANELVSLLNSGALPAPLTVEQERIVGAGLGADTIASGKIGSVVGVIFILVFMVLLYGVFGLFADIVLIVNLMMIIGMSAFFGATLTLPGIAGIVLTLGMAVDANILPFERIRDEVRAGVPTLRAVDYGFDRSTKTVLDGELTNLICALILFQFGAGPIRGFAVTLSIGVITTLFTCLLLTRVFVDWYMNGKNKKIGYTRVK